MTHWDQHLWLVIRIKRWARAAASLLLVLGFTGVSTAQDRDVKLIKNAEVNYPWLAGVLRIEGHCFTSFIIDQRGYVVAPTVECTKQIFCASSKKGVLETEFEPKLKSGTAVMRRNVHIPMSYKLEGSDYTVETDPNPLEPCEEIAVS